MDARGDGAASQSDEVSFVGRCFAGILGLLAFSTSIVRGIVAGLDASPAIGQACGWMVVMAALGLAAGAVASRLVEESVRTRFASELDARKAGPDSAG